MKTHTSQFKENISLIGKQLDSKITYELNGVVQTLTSEQLNSITPTFQGAILKSVMKELDLDSNIDIPLGTIINYKFGVLVDNAYEYLDFGNYIVYSSEKQEDTSSYKIICYDKMLNSMKQNEDLGITYPINVRDYINALCTKIGLEFKNKNDEFANFDRILDKELYVGLDYTYRDILDELAQVTASTIGLNLDDKVEIKYPKVVGETKIKSGTNIQIKEDSNISLTSMKIDGKSTQETSTDPVSPSPDHPSEIKIVKGDENGNLKIKVTRKNLFNIGTDNGIRLNVSTIYNGSEYTLNGTTNSSGNLFSTLGSKQDYRYLGKYKSGTYHVKNYISGSVTIPPAKDFATYIRDDSNNLVVNMNRDKLIDNDFTLMNDTDLYIQMYTNSANIVFDNFNVKIQIEEGTVATDYEPYTEEVANIDLKGNELYSLPNGVKDELIIKEGTTKIIKKIGKVVLDGVHNGFDYKHPTLRSDNKGFYRFKLPGKSISYPSGEVGTALSNYFVEVSGPAHIAFGNNSSGLWWEGRTEYAYMILEKTSLAEANNWLSTHNTTVYYELETPKEIDLEQTIAIKTYKKLTNISNSEDANMEISYISPETIDEEYLKDINVNFG